MLIESDKLGIVKVSTHAKRRFKQRFNLKKKCMFSVIKRSLDMGQTIGRYHIYNNVCLVLEPQYDYSSFKVVTILNADTILYDEKKVLNEQIN